MMKYRKFMIMGVLSENRLLNTLRLVIYLNICDIRLIPSFFSCLISESDNTRTFSTLWSHSLSLDGEVEVGCVICKMTILIIIVVVCSRCISFDKVVYIVMKVIPFEFYLLVDFCFS